MMVAKGRCLCTDIAALKITRHLPELAQLPYLDAMIARMDISDPHLAHSQVILMVQNTAQSCSQSAVRLETVPILSAKAN